MRISRFSPECSDTSPSVMRGRRHSLRQPARVRAYPAWLARPLFPSSCTSLVSLAVITILYTPISRLCTPYPLYRNQNDLDLLERSKAGNRRKTGGIQFEASMTHGQSFRVFSPSPDDVRFGNRPASDNARRRRNSTWPLTLRRSSSAQRRTASSICGSIRRRNDLRSAKTHLAASDRWFPC